MTQWGLDIGRSPFVDGFPMGLLSRLFGSGGRPSFSAEAEVHVPVAGGVFEKGCHGAEPGELRMPCNRHCVTDLSLIHVTLDYRHKKRTCNKSLQVLTTKEFFKVRMRGFEPPRPVRALEPESSASANSATSAGSLLYRRNRQGDSRG